MASRGRTRRWVPPLQAWLLAHLGIGCATGMHGAPGAPTQQPAEVASEPASEPASSARPVSASDPETRVAAWAAERYGPCIAEALETLDDVVDMVLVETAPLPDGRVLATVWTPCHALRFDGAYNTSATLLELRDGRVSPARFAPAPAWAQKLWSEETDDGLPLAYEVSFEREGGEIQLVSGLRMRAFGDSGWQERFRFTDAGYALVERRDRDGGELLVDAGKLPIVGPPAARCSASLSLDGAQATPLRVTTWHGETKRDHQLALRDASCSVFTESVVQCRAPDGVAVEYQLVDRAGAWAVVRLVSGDESRAGEQVAAVARTCEL